MRTLSGLPQKVKNKKRKTPKATQVCASPYLPLPNFLQIKFADGVVLEQSRSALCRRGICAHRVIDMFIDRGLIEYPEVGSDTYTSPHRADSSEGFAVRSHSYSYSRRPGSFVSPYEGRA